MTTKTGPFLKPKMGLDLSPKTAQVRLVLGAIFWPSFGAQFWGLVLGSSFEGPALGSRSGVCFLTEAGTRKCEIWHPNRGQLVDLDPALYEDAIPACDVYDTRLALLIVPILIKDIVAVSVRCS